MLYDPDPGAIPNSTWFTRQLSQRDLSLQVPVNYVTVPAISLTPACFAQKRYADVPTAKCFSNLLALGFERFEVDIYWDASRHLWSLCPVELGVQTISSSSTSSPVSTTTSGTGAPKFNVFAHLKKRQARSKDENLAAASSQTGTSSSPDALTSVTATTTLNPTSPITSPNASPTLPSGELIDVGPYACTTSDNVSLLGQVLYAHLESTQNKLNATMKYLILNLHAAASASDPTGSPSAPATSDLPMRGGLLSSLISKHVGLFLYTPKELLSERADLNVSSSWYGGDESSFEPDPSYFEIIKSHGHYSTQDGWPSESFVEMQIGKRIMISYGQVDPQMQAYDFAADSSVIFPRGYIQSNVSVTTNSLGQVKNGCFYQPDTYSLSKLNNSWAISTDLSDVGTSAEVYKIVSNLTYCGISPILNETLNKVTADLNYEPYQDYVQSAIWCWAAGEPGNRTKPGDNSPTANRCAAMNATSGYWQTENCAATYFNACRTPGDIYNWVISNSATSYMEAGVTCPAGTQFTVPYTSLENTYLLQKWRATIAAKGIGSELLWLDFNDLDVKQCWVIGQNETCPYEGGSDTDREVIVPIIAAIIVFVLAGLTIFVKCAANRQQYRTRRRRGDDGWDYEGVPS